MKKSLIKIQFYINTQATLINVLDQNKVVSANISIANISIDISTLEYVNNRSTLIQKHAIYRKIIFVTKIAI